MLHFNDGYTVSDAQTVDFSTMVRLNKSHLQAKQIDQLFSQLARVIAPKNSSHAQAVLTEILGREEQIMIAKRLAVIVLLSEGYSAYKIADLLKLSQSTIATTAHRLQNGKYAFTQETLGKKSKKDYFAFLEIIDEILHLGGILPHYNGFDRYPKW